MRVGYCLEGALDPRWDFMSQFAGFGSNKLYWRLVTELRTALERQTPRRMVLITFGKFTHEHRQAD